MTLIAPTLEAFFTERLAGQRKAEHRGRRFGAGVENGGVAAEVPGRLAGDGQAPGFGAFPEQVRGEPPGVDVGEVRVHASVVWACPVALVQVLLVGFRRGLGPGGTCRCPGFQPVVAGRRQASPAALAHDAGGAIGSGWCG